MRLKYKRNGKIFKLNLSNYFKIKKRNYLIKLNNKIATAERIISNTQMNELKKCIKNITVIFKNKAKSKIHKNK